MERGESRLPRADAASPTRLRQMTNPGTLSAPSSSSHAASGGGGAVTRRGLRAGDRRRRDRRRAGARCRRVSRLPCDTHLSRGDRRLRGPHRVLGRRHRDCHGVRGRQHLPRAPVAAPRPDDGADRGDAGLAHRHLRLGRPAAAGRARGAASHPGGGSVRVSAPGTGPPRRPRHGGGRGHPAERGRRGGPHHRRAPAQARAVRGLEAARGVGGGARRARAEPGRESRAGRDDSRAAPRRLPPVAREPGVSRLDGGRDPPGHERAGVVGGDDVGSRTRRPGAARPGRRRPARRPLPAPDARRRTGGRTGRRTGGRPRRRTGGRPRRRTGGRPRRRTGGRPRQRTGGRPRRATGAAAPPGGAAGSTPAPRNGLAELLAGVDDPARLAEVGDWIVGCATGDELLERCSSLRGPRPPGSS